MRATLARSPAEAGRRREKRSSRRDVPLAGTALRAGLVGRRKSPRIEARTDAAGWASLEGLLGGEPEWIWLMGDGWMVCLQGAAGSEHTIALHTMEGPAVEWAWPLDGIAPPAPCWWLDPRTENAILMRTWQQPAASTERLPRVHRLSAIGGAGLWQSLPPTTAEPLVAPRPVQVVVPEPWIPPAATAFRSTVVEAAGRDIEGAQFSLLGAVPLDANARAGRLPCWLADGVRLRIEFLQAAKPIGSVLAGAPGGLLEVSLGR